VILIRILDLTIVITSLTKKCTKERVLMTH
jgi:hypothetical protein